MMMTVEPPDDSPRPLFGALAGTIGSDGDLIAPVDVEWDTEGHVRVLDAG